MADLLRWSEDRVVDWRRVEGGAEVMPRLTFTDRTRGTHLRLAVAFARLAARSGDALHRAKAEALAGAMLVAQHPLSGQLPPFSVLDHGDVRHGMYHGPGSGDGGNRGEYETLALLELAQLWEPQAGRSAR